MNSRLTETTNLLLLLTAGTAGNLVIDADEAHITSKYALGSDPIHPNSLSEIP